METVQNMLGKEIKVGVIEGREPNEYALGFDFDGQASVSINGYKEGGDFTLYSMTPEAMASLAWAIIEAAAKAKAAREMKPTPNPTSEEEKKEAAVVGS